MSKEIKKASLQAMLDTITKREYLTRKDLLKLLEITTDFAYMYDFLSCLDEWKITQKGFTAKDGVGNSIQFNDRVNRDMQFYKSGFLVCE